MIKKLGLLLVIQLFLLVEINAQGWLLSNVIKGSNIEPKYAVIDNQDNSIIGLTF